MRISGSAPINTSQIQYKQEEKDGVVFKDILEQTQQAKDDKKLLDTCKQLESVFVNMLFKSMRSGVPGGGFIERSYERQTFEEMFDEKVADEISKGQGIGLAKEIYKQLTRNRDAIKNFDE